MTSATVLATCLICGSTEEPTEEHIVPQTLWRKLELDPGRDDLARYRTTLCDTHNRATSALHERSEAMDLIATGAPVTRRTLTHLGDWAVWVTLLLGLANGQGMLRPEEARRLLANRFDGRKGGPPTGCRVYAARVAEYTRDTEYLSHMVAVEHDDRILLDRTGKVAGLSVSAGPITASSAFGLGNIAILVLPRTYPSGRTHNNRLDLAAKAVGLGRIHPMEPGAPTLDWRAIDISAVSRVFMPPPHGSDTSLLPPAIRGMVELMMPPA